MWRLAGLVVVMLCGSCAITSRAMAGYGAIADAPGCGGVLSAIAIAIDGAAIAGIVYDGEVSSGGQVALIGLGADAFIGGIMALQDCLGD